jgi:hypothetical protein
MANKSIQIQMQAIPSHDEYVVSKVSSSNSMSMTSKLALLIGTIYVMFFGLLVQQIHQMVPAAIFVADNQQELHKFFSFSSSMSDASVTLFHGSLPQLVNDLLTSDLSEAAYDTEVFANSVHTATCVDSNNKVDFPDQANFYISKYASLVHSVANQIANMNDLTHNDDQTDDTQLTGTGGLALEPLKYVTDWIAEQTDTTQWKNAACSCVTLASQLKSAMSFSDYYGPDCGQSSMKWDVSSKANSYLESVSTSCASLCDNLVPSENVLQE